MRHILASLAFALLLYATPATADDQPVVVELYTSQGCSSCPPADKFLTKLAKRRDVIALALHVDYWDYLGWKDHFASEVFSSRQRAYAKAAQKRTVYTPQVIVQGVSHAIGNRPQDVQSLIAYHANRAKVVDIDLRRNGNVLVVRVSASDGNVGRSVIQLVRYLPEKTVEIRAGENAGRRIVYSNIVSRWEPISVWNGRSDFMARKNIFGSEPVVVLVQTENYGPILAAEVLR